MVGKPRGFEVDPTVLLEAAAKLREMAHDDYRAFHDIELGLTAQGDVPRPFGQSDRARELAANWDKAVGARMKCADTLAEETLWMAEALADTAAAYQGTDQRNGLRIENIHYDLDIRP